jgi:hypothetical protein
MQGEGKIWESGREEGERTGSSLGALEQSESFKAVAGVS